MTQEQLNEYWDIQWDIAVTDDKERKLLQRQKELKGSVAESGLLHRT